VQLVVVSGSFKILRCCSLYLQVRYGTSPHLRNPSRDGMFNPYNMQSISEFAAYLSNSPHSIASALSVSGNPHQSSSPHSRGGGPSQRDIDNLDMDTTMSAFDDLYNHVSPRNNLTDSPPRASRPSRVDNPLSSSQISTTSSTSSSSHRASDPGPQLGFGSGNRPRSGSSSVLTAGTGGAGVDDLFPSVSVPPGSGTNPFTNDDQLCAVTSTMKHEPSTASSASSSAGPASKSASPRHSAPRMESPRVKNMSPRGSSARRPSMSQRRKREGNDTLLSMSPRRSIPRGNSSNDTSSSSSVDIVPDFPSCDFSESIFDLVTH